MSLVEKIFNRLGIKRKTEKTQLQEREYRQILDSIEDLILVKGPKSKVIWANAAFREYYGMTNEQLKGIIDAPFVEPDYTQQYILDDAYVFETGNVLDIPEEPVTHHQGEVRFFHTIKAPIRNKNNEVIMSVGVSRDITERKNSEKLLREQQSALISSSKMSALGEMAGAIAHEINNPLAVIIAKADQLVREVSGGQLKEDRLVTGLEKIESTAHQIAKIVKSLKFFSRKSEGDPMTIHPIKQILDETLEFCREKFKTNQIELEISDFPNTLIECRPSQISQILVNLLNNACDAVKGTQNPFVRVEFEQNNDNCIKIIVKDSGHGISPTIAAKMMDPFFTTKEIGQGTGLGLSIAKGISEAYGGSLIYDATSPNTSFVLTIPLRQNVKKVENHASNTQR